LTWRRAGGSRPFPRDPINKDCPDSRPIMPRRIEKVVAIPQVGGLHHRYECLAA
jgi:hypothetical protein